MITPYSNTIQVTTEKFPFEFTINTANTSTGSSAADQFRLPLVSSLPLNAVVDWGDGSSDTITVFNQPEVTHTYDTTSTTEFTISITGDLSGWQFANSGDRLKMLEITSWETLTISTDQGFFGCTNMTCTATDAPIITGTSLFAYFTFCSNFNGAIGNWDVSNIEDMTYLFIDTPFNSDISAWNTSNLRILLQTFQDCPFNQDISTKTINSGLPNEYVAWDVSNVTNLGSCFLRNTAFNQPIGNWDVSNVLDFNATFRSATAFNQDIGNWDVSNGNDFRSFMLGKSAANYDAQYLSNIYEKWSLQTLSPNESISFGSIKYNTSGAIGKNRLTNAPNNWVISDGGQEAPFEFTVKTDNAGVSTSTEFRMPLTTSTNLGFTVNWGDGSPLETITDHTLAIHDYGVAGTYTISVTGALLGWQFNNGGDKLKMLNVAQWAGLNISVSNGFHSCTNLTATATDAPLITTNSFRSYFQSCTNFNGAIGNWNVSSVTNFDLLFFGASKFNQPIGDWILSSNPSTMFATFLGASLFNQNIGNWDVSNVTSMFRMFQNATAFNNGGLADINNWTIRSLGTSMGEMFSGASAFNQNIGAWNISNVTDFSWMFSNATAFNNGGSDDIDNWTFSTTSNINMSGMFGGTNTTLSCKFNRYIGSWNTERVTNMSSMFANNTAFNQDIGAWNVSNVTNFTNFMAGKSAANYSAANLDSIYNGWSSRPVQPNINISFGSIAYTSQSQAGKDILTNAPNNWVITDGSVAFQYTADVSIAGTSGVGFFQLPLVSDGNTINSIVDWGDGTTSAVTAFNDVDTLHDYNVTTGAAGIKTITISGLFSGWQFNDGGDKLKMRNLSSWGALKISVEAGFYGCTNMTATATDVPVITSTSLAKYFEATKFNGELNYWDVSGVSNFSRMFRIASQFNQPLDLWDMSNATDLRTMFGGSLFNQNVNSWNVSNVTNFINTFAYCNFNQPLDLWVLNISQPIDMTGMFEANNAFNQNIGSWNTISVTIMRFMFDDCPTFNNDGDSSIGAWNTSNVTRMDNMFFNATAFNQDIGNWNVSNVTNFTNFIAGKTAANYSAANLDSIYNGWSSRPVQPNLSISFGTIKYTAAGQAGKDILTGAPNLWVIVDGGI